MSQYAWITCSDCSVAIWLGKVVYSESGAIDYFKIGSKEDPPNSQQISLNRVLWKFLAQHTGHKLKVITNLDPDYKYLGEYIEIGGDETGDIDVNQFLIDWRG